MRKRNSPKQIVSFFLCVYAERARSLCCSRSVIYWRDVGTDSDFPTNNIQHIHRIVYRVPSLAPSPSHPLQSIHSMCMCFLCSLTSLHFFLDNNSQTQQINPKFILLIVVCVPVCVRGMSVLFSISILLFRNFASSSSSVCVCCVPNNAKRMRRSLFTFHFIRLHLKCYHLGLFLIIYYCWNKTCRLSHK